MTMDPPKLRVTGRIEEVTLEYKVLVLGCSQVGKSSLIGRYTTGKFRSAMMSTVGKRPAANFIIFSLCLNILSMHWRPELWRPELRDTIVKFGFAPLSNSRIGCTKRCHSVPVDLKSKALHYPSITWFSNARDSTIKSDVTFSPMVPPARGFTSAHHRKLMSAGLSRWNHIDAE